MKITGTSTLAASPDAVFAALNDPAVLAATIPGCRRLEALGEDAYAMTVAAGVGSIKGVYDGQVRLADHDAPTSFRLHASGSGAPGTISADVLVRLSETAAGTELSYDADAEVGGMIGGVGQRMLVGVSKRLAAEFFGNVDALMLGAGAARLSEGAEAPKPTGASRLPPGPSTDAPAPSDSPAAPVGTVFAPPQAGRGGSGFARGVAVGAAAALAGAVVGAWISRRALP
jgi:carbon monoxide dehydrogenase subunit G